MASARTCAISATPKSRDSTAFLIRRFLVTIMRKRLHAEEKEGRRRPSLNWPGYDNALNVRMMGHDRGATEPIRLKIF
jgi:hypothetical protein